MDSPPKGPVMHKAFPCHNVFMKSSYLTFLGTHVPDENLNAFSWADFWQMLSPLHRTDQFENNFQPNAHLFVNKENMWIWHTTLNLLFRRCFNSIYQNGRQFITTHLRLFSHNLCPFTRRKLIVPMVTITELLACHSWLFHLENHCFGISNFFETYRIYTMLAILFADKI